MKIYLVWEREAFDEYDVILITQDEEKAKQLSGEDAPCFYHDKKNDDTERYFEERVLEKEYSLFQN